MKIALITVNYNNSAATGRLVKSLEAQSDRDFELIVVDNASTSQDRAALGKIMASVALNTHVHWSDVNNGFAAGSNIGIKRALQQDATWTVLVNNDAVVGQEAIASLKRALVRMQPAVVALPLFEHGKTVRAGLIRWLSSTLPHTFNIPHPRERIYAVGGGMAIHRAVFERLGSLDERYFLYFEDAEYSERARAAGIPVLTADIPALSHEVSATTSKLGSPLLLRYHMRNALLFNRTHAPWWAVLLLPSWTFFVIVKQVFKLIIPQLGNAQRDAAYAILHGIDDFYRGRFGIIHDNYRDRVRVH